MATLAALNVAVSSPYSPCDCFSPHVSTKQNKFWELE